MANQQQISDFMPSAPSFNMNQQELYPPTLYPPSLYPPSVDMMYQITTEQRKERQEKIIKEYEISEDIKDELYCLEHPIILVVDNSSSMQSKAVDNTTYSANKDKLNSLTTNYASRTEIDKLLSENENGLKRTRWDEAKNMTELCINIYSSYNIFGLDVHFLNSFNSIKSLYNVNNFDIVKNYFEYGPNGSTPLYETLNTIKNISKYQNTQIKSVVIITDGEPSDCDDAKLRTLIEEMIKNNFYITLVPCTSSKSVIDFYNKMDDLDHLDVVDDYVSEWLQVKSVQGKDFMFSKDMYYLKILGGSTNDKLDKLDESPNLSKKYNKIDKPTEISNMSNSTCDHVLTPFTSDKNNRKNKHNCVLL